MNYISQGPLYGGKISRDASVGRDARLHILRGKFLIVRAQWVARLSIQDVSRHFADLELEFKYSFLPRQRSVQTGTTFIFLYGHSERRPLPPNVYPPA